MGSRLMQFRGAAIQTKAQKDMKERKEERKIDRQTEEEKEREKGERKKKNVRLCRLRAQGDNQETKEEK